MEGQKTTGLVLGVSDIGCCCHYKHGRSQSFISGQCGEVNAFGK